MQQSIFDMNTSPRTEGPKAYWDANNNNYAVCSRVCPPPVTPSFAHQQYKCQDKTMLWQLFINYVRSDRDHMSSMRLQCNFGCIVHRTLSASSAWSSVDDRPRESTVGNYCTSCRPIMAPWLQRIIAEIPEQLLIISCTIDTYNLDGTRQQQQ